MSEQDYASKDLKRRPFHTTMMLVSLISVIATTTFLFLFGNVLLDVTTVLTSSGLSSALGVFFQGFIWATIILVLVLGVVVVSSTISMEIVSRSRDIGLMKSIGTLTDTIFDHFMAQAIILLLSSIGLGIAVGVAAYIAGLAWLASVLPGVSFTFQFPWLQLLFISVIYLIVGYFAAQKPIYDIVQESPSKALNPDLGMRVRKSGFLDGFGLPFRLAAKATGRRVKGSRRTMLSLFLSITLASMLWVGGGVVETTTDAYVMRSMGQNIIAVGGPGLLAQYYEAYSLTGTPLNDSFSFLESDDLIPESLITDITDLPGVHQAEGRLLDYTTFQENPAIILNPQTGDYERIGGDRAASTLVVGLDREDTISDWYFEGEDILGNQQVWLGGEMAVSYFEDPLIQSLGVMGRSLDVTAVAFDILNGGMLALMPLDDMQAIWGVDGVNILLVQVNQVTSSLVEQIENLIGIQDFDVFIQDEVLQQNLDTINSFWALLQPLPLIALLSAFLSLMNYLLVSVFGRFKDYVIMRSVGAKPSFIAKTMVAEGVGVGLSSGIPAVITATLFSVYALVPEAAVPSLLYLPMSMAVMLLLLVVVVIVAAIPVYLIFTSGTDLRVSEFAV